MKLKITTFVLLSIILLPTITWAGVTKTQISELYAAILNRASEGEGNRFWRTLELDMATTADVIGDRPRFFGLHCTMARSPDQYAQTTLCDFVNFVLGGGKNVVCPLLIPFFVFFP
jgi:hypothetical protein